MQDTIFTHVDDAPFQKPTAIVVITSCSASEDLRILIERIQRGDTPGTRELIGILTCIRDYVLDGQI